MKLTYLKTYKLEFFFIFALTVLSFLILSGNSSNGNSYADSEGIFWLPSAVMQSVAALYGVFIAIFILSLQNNKENIHSLANRIKPPLKIVSYTAAGTIYFNGLILIVFSLNTFSETRMKFMLFFSLVSMVLSLIAIIYSSMNLLSDVSGLKTSSEKFTYISNLLQLQQDKSIGPLQNEKDMNFCIRALDDENPEVRKVAAKVLGNIQNSKAEESLFKTLEDPSMEVRTIAVKALACTGSENSTDTLINQLEKMSEIDCEPSYQICIIEALGKLHNERAVEPLIKTLEDKNFQIRAAALHSLEILGGERVEEALITKLDAVSDSNKIHSTHSEFQKQVIFTLGNVKSKKAVHVLIHKLEDKNPEIRKYAAESLGKIKDTQAVDPLLNHISDRNPEVRNSVAYSLGILKAEKAINPLLKMLTEKDPELRITAVYALGNIGNPKAIISLLETLKDNNSWVRKYAAEALGKIGDPQAVNPLVKNLNDPDPEVRWTAAEALRMLSQKNPDIHQIPPDDASLN
ncbi:MAG: HEAT repeat domain-containing protein [Methanosarcina sp.]